MDTRFGKNSTIPHIALDRMRRARFVYWVVVSSLATLVILTTLSAALSRQFTTTVILPLKAIPPAFAGEQPEQCQQLLVDSIKHLNRDSELAAIFYGEAANADIPLLDSIRRRLTYALLPASASQPVSVQVNFLGNGSTAEQDFLKRFADLLDQQIRQKFSTAVFPQGIEPTHSATDRQTQVDDIRQRLTRTFQEMEILASHLNQAKESLQQGLQQQRIGPELGQQKKWLFELDQLQSQKSELLSKYTVTHPSIVELQLRIESLKESLAELESSAPNANPYQTASYQKTTDTQIWLDLAAKMKDLDISQVQTTLIQLEQSWNGLLWELEQSPDGQTRSTTAPSELRSQTVQTKANGLLGQRYFPLVITLLSLGIGVLVAAVASHHFTDRGFDSAGEASETLGLPIIGNVAVTRAARRPESKADLGFRRLLKLSELLLFTTLLVVTAIAVRSPEIRQALLENPIQALCQVVWTIRG